MWARKKKKNQILNEKWTGKEHSLSVICLAATPWDKKKS
jgi:hypothetical protein